MATPIWNDKEKRWTLRVTVNGTTHKFTSRTEGLAGKRKVLAAARDFGHYGTKNITVRDVRDDWLRNIELRLGKDSVSYMQAESLSRLFILPKLGKRRIRDVKLRDWQQIINEAKPQDKKKGSLSKKYLSNLRANINLLIKYAYENEYTEPLRGSLYIPAGHPVVGKEVLTPDDVKKLLDPSDNWYWPAWVLMVLTGMRPGEVYGLQNDDFDGMTLTIRRAVNEQRKITEGKNRNARRTVPLHPFARKLIQDTIERNEPLHTVWIFPNKKGQRCNPHGVRKAWTSFAKSRGIPGTPYSLRHTFVSMVKSTMPEPLLKALVGHSAQMDTIGIYGHHLDRDDVAAVGYIEEVFK